MRVGREALGAGWGRPATYLRVPGSRPRARPSASPPPPALHVAPRLLRGRRRPEPRRARARLPAPAPAPRRLARRPREHRAAFPSPAPLAGERRQRRLPHVSPGCPVSQQFPPGPQRRLRRCCHRLSHIPGLQRSRRRRRAAPRPLPLALLLPAPRLPLTPPARLGPARSGKQRRRPPRGRRSPQPTIHRAPPPGREGRGPGRGGALAASGEGPRRGRLGCSRRSPGAGNTPRGSSAPPLIDLHAKAETHAELYFSPPPFPHPSCSQERPEAAFRLPWDWPAIPQRSPRPPSRPTDSPCP